MTQARLTDSPFSSVLGRCSGCAGRWPAETPPALCLVAWEPSLQPPVGELAASIHRVVGRSRKHVAAMLGDHATAAEAARASRTDIEPWPLKRGQRLEVRCPRCKTEHRMRAAHVLAQAEAARGEGSGDFYVP